MTDTDRVVIDTPAQLLEYMRRVALEFQQNYENFHTILGVGLGGSRLTMDLRPAAMADQKLKANALLVIAVPRDLGFMGLKLLTDTERRSLESWIAVARSILLEERPDGTFVSTYSLLALCRYEDNQDTFFDRIIARLEAEEGPRLLRQRHIDALHAIITAPGMGDVMADRIQDRFAEEGVVFWPAEGRLLLWEWQRPRGIEAALILIELGIPVVIDGQEIAGAELLYALGFRARLDDQ